MLAEDGVTLPAETGQEEEPTELPAPPTPSRSQLPAAPTPTATPASVEGPREYGRSFKGYALEYYIIGTGNSRRAVIGGIHGGYEWNTIDLVYEILAYLQEDPTRVPDDVTLYVIPCANPDGYHYYREDGADPFKARENGNGVDLNRNWDYGPWQSQATHGTRPVSAGDRAFSEPETKALRDLILGDGPGDEIEAAIFYHSAMGKVFYGAEVGKSATYDLAVAVYEATEYSIAATVPGQITTGDAIDWMSDQGLAGIEVELTNHQDIDWERNLRGLEAFLGWVHPDSSPEQVPAQNTETIGTHVVQEGDTLLAIALRFDVDLGELASLNGIEVNAILPIGERLRIPSD